MVLSHLVKWCCLTLLNGGVLTLYGLLKHITGLIVASDGMLTLTVSSVIKQE